MFFSLNSYKNIELFLLDLNKNKEKINLSIDAKKIKEGIYFSNKILSIQKVIGKTEWEK